MVNVKIYIEGGGEGKYLVLVDGEDAILKGHTAWQHLKARDDWDKPKNATDEHAYLMAQVMETWLLADKDTLRVHFGSNFKSGKIPAWTDLESVPKQSVFDALNKATVECGEKQYAKGKISFDLLGKIDPEKVKRKCLHAKRILDFLAEIR